MDDNFLDAVDETFLTKALQYNGYVPENVKVSLQYNGYVPENVKVSGCFSSI